MTSQHHHIREIFFLKIFWVPHSLLPRGKLTRGVKFCQVVPHVFPIPHFPGECHVILIIFPMSKSKQRNTANSQQTPVLKPLSPPKRGHKKSTKNDQHSLPVDLTIPLLRKNLDQLLDQYFLDFPDFPKDRNQWSEQQAKEYKSFQSTRQQAWCEKTLPFLIGLPPHKDWSSKDKKFYNQVRKQVLEFQRSPSEPTPQKGPPSPTLARPSLDERCKALHEDFASLSPALQKSYMDYIHKVNLGQFPEDESTWTLDQDKQFTDALEAAFKSWCSLPLPAKLGLPPRNEWTKEQNNLYEREKKKPGHRSASRSVSPSRAQKSQQQPVEPQIPIISVPMKKPPKVPVLTSKEDPPKEDPSSQQHRGRKRDREPSEDYAGDMDDMEEEDNTPSTPAGQPPPQKRSRKEYSQRLGSTSSSEPSSESTHGDVDGPDDELEDKVFYPSTKKIKLDNPDPELASQPIVTFNLNQSVTWTHVLPVSQRRFFLRKVAMALIASDFKM